MSAARLREVDARLSDLRARMSNAAREVERLQDALADALAGGDPTGELHARLAHERTEIEAIPSAIKRLEDERRELRAAQTLEEAAEKELAIEAEGEALRQPFATVADAVAAIVPELEKHPGFATILVGDHAVSIANLSDVLRSHVDRVVRFRANQIQSNAQLRAQTQRTGSRDALQEPTLGRRFATGDLGTYEITH